MLQGSCHCGAVTWQFDGVPQSALACSCTVCRRYGTLWAYDFEGGRIQVSGPTRAYRRGERHLEFHFCPDCGCIAYWRGVKPREDMNPREEGRRRIGFNLRLADPDAVAAIPVKHFDGLTWADEPVMDGRTVADMWF